MPTSSGALPKRKPSRMARYDYRTPGTYFVTFCSKDRACLLGSVDAVINLLAEALENRVGQGPCPCRLSGIGMIVDEEIRSLGDRYEQVAIEKYVIMPNHVHLLVTLRQGRGPCPTVSTLVGSLKSAVSRRCNQRQLLGDHALWQTSFHDHVVRGQADFDRLWAYIDDNPRQWRDDVYYTEE